MPIRTNDIRKSKEHEKSMKSIGTRKISAEVGQSMDRDIQTTLINDMSQEILMNDKETSIDMKVGEVQLSRITPKAVVRQISKA